MARLNNRFLPGYQSVKRTVGMLFLLNCLVGGSCFAQSKKQLPNESFSKPDESISHMELWYDQPAKDWTDALPIGNGHIGAMIYGGAQSEHIQFNEATLWTGRPREYAHSGAVAYLQPMRKLLREGQQKKAEDLATDHFMGLKDHDPKQYEIAKQKWLNSVRDASSIKAASSQFDDRSWKTMKLPMIDGWESDGFQGLDGALWFRQSFVLPKDWEGKDLYLDLGRIRDQDYTYINGHLVDSGAGISYKRHYLIKSSYLKAGKNVIAIQVINFFDKGGFTGVKGGQKIFVLYPQTESTEQGLMLSRSWKYHIQDSTPPAYPQFEASYQPFGDIYFAMTDEGNKPIRHYKRDLNIENSIAGVSYERDGIQYHREYFASSTNRILGIHFSATKKKAINFQAWFGTVHEIHAITKLDDSTIALKVQVKDGALFGVAYLRVRTKGSQAKVTIKDNQLLIKSADEASLFLSAATNFKSYNDVSGNPDGLCKAYLNDIKSCSFNHLREQHIKRYRSYFEPFQISLGDSKNAKNNLPTNQRILKYTDSTDQGLIALYVQYARYLLISSSPPDGRAANLQGIWNELLTPPWGSKYTTNINLEMNYWPAEILNLSACTAPLFSLIHTLSITGQSTAKLHYGADGWVEHHNTDIWGATAPIDASDHGVWVTGSGWLCHHLWEHYLFTGDIDFLRDTAYPIIKSSALFYSEFLSRDSTTGYLISSPSNSPEHGGMVAGPTMDHQIIRDVFNNYLAAEKILHLDIDFAKKISQQVLQIAPNKIGRYGQLQEWMQDIDDSSDTHRHVSHLWGVYPGNDISWNDSAMMRAAEKSLIFRGDGGTGWSLAWKLNLWSRFKNSNHAIKIIDELLRSAECGTGSERGGVYHNLFDAHPPFQIDGNFGAAAGIAEMLLQSQSGYLDILPALPEVLKEGNVKGLCARGGFQIDLDWSDGHLIKCRVYSKLGGICRVHYENKQVVLNTVKGGVYLLNSDLRSSKQNE